MIHGDISTQVNLTYLLNNISQELDSVSQKILLLEGNIFNYMNDARENKGQCDIHDFDIVIQVVEELSAFIRRIGPSVGPVPELNIGPAIAAIKLKDLKDRIIGLKSGEIISNIHSNNIEIF